MNLSLISFQMMRVISSPSSSTTGFLTLILEGEVEEAMPRDCCELLPPMRRCSAASLVEAVDAILKWEEGYRRWALIEDLLVAAPTTADLRGFMCGGGG